MHDGAVYPAREGGSAGRKQPCNIVAGPSLLDAPYFSRLVVQRSGLTIKTPLEDTVR